MDITSFLQTAQEILSACVAMIPPLDFEPNVWMTAIHDFDVPVPDAAILAAFLVLLVLIRRSHRTALAGVQDLVEDTYRAELLTANRRVYQARNDLRKAELEIERERQRKRRLQYQTARRTPKVTHLREIKDRAVTRPRSG